MTRPVLMLMCAAIVVLVFIGLRAVFQSVRPNADPVAAGAIDDSIVALDDGSVLVAKPGTTSRSIIDWLNNERAPPQTFDVGWQPFQPNSAQPAPASKVRLDRLATELNASPDVDATIVVCSSANNGGDHQLAVARGHRLQAELEARQIDADRISTGTCIAKANGSAPSESDQDGQVVRLVLNHGG